MDTLGTTEEELFEAARGLAPGEDRRRFLERECRGDPALRTAVDRLLSASDRADGYFAEGGAALERLKVAVPALGAPPETPGTRIGRYRLIEQLGEGGCGAVYLAEQEEPVKRPVALKIIRLGMETRSVIARFEVERQALAMMDHPNIARVFDAGATELGLPYFVMELVRGARITDYCDRQALGVRERLELFVHVCHAIQHAHQKGVIHRDIKPSNIIVELHDGTAVPKVIDFGIAKATTAPLLTGASTTAHAQLIGTPTYMSPEQVELDRIDIDTRSDIYSLGVLLFELLTGFTPFDAARLADCGFDELRRILREEEPARPSARLASLPGERLAAVAAQRRTEPDRLLSLLRGDLDWIVTKALEKDRRRRYETANGLAMDIQRHLQFEPVIARPPSWLYQFQKLVRRNRVVFAAGGAVAAALVIGMGTSTWLFLREREARQRAHAAEQQQARLREEAELRERLTQAALLVNREQFAEADELCRGVIFAAPTVEGAAVLRSLGEWHALHGRHREAAERFERLLQTDELDGWDVATLDALRLGPELIAAGEMVRYSRFRQGLIARYARTPSLGTDRVLKISLLVPLDEPTVRGLAPIAELTKRQIEESDRNNDGFVSAWRSLSVCLWELRSGNAAGAVEWGRRCLGYPDFNGPRMAAAHAVIALGLKQRGHTEEAARELGKARELMGARLHGRLDRGTPIQGFWFDWALARLLFQEALAAPGDPTPAARVGDG